MSDEFAQHLRLVWMEFFSTLPRTLDQVLKNSIQTKAQMSCPLITHHSSLITHHSLLCVGELFPRFPDGLPKGCTIKFSQQHPRSALQSNGAGEMVGTIPKTKMSGCRTRQPDIGPVLLTQTKLFDQRAVLVNIFFRVVSQKALALCNHC